jgi:folylpolyglutamate synthase/dihydropteroate synthase
VTDALAAAGRVAGADDVIVVTGSLYLVGAARDLLGGAVA